MEEEHLKSTSEKFQEALSIDFEHSSDEFLEEFLPSNYRDIIKEIRDDEEYQYLVNMPNELIKSTKEYNFKMYKNIRAYNKLNPKAGLLTTAEEKAFELQRCKYDILYFVENYVFVQFVGGVIKFKLNDKIRCKLRLYEASVMHLFMTSRQSSKTQSSLVGDLWYFNFWKRSKMTLVNTKLDENEKNLREIMSMEELLPDWMKTFNPDHKEAIDNVRKKISPLKSEIAIGVVDRFDPKSSLRGKTSALDIDEVAYLKKVSEAYSAIAFITSTYSKMAKRTYTPSPFALTSTPNDINTENGSFWHELWSNAYEVKYEEIKDLLPFEIQEYFNKINVVVTKVEQYWYEFPDRARYVDATTVKFKRKYHHILMNPDASIDEIRKIDDGLATWLLETKAIAQTLSNIKKDIYCMFLTSSSESIFEEFILDEMYKSIREPIRELSIPGIKDGFVRFYKELESSEAYFHYFTVFDAAYSLIGDYVGATILDRRDMSIVAVVRFRPGRVKKTYPVIKWIVKDLFDGEISFAVERNSFGISVVEDCEDDPYLKTRLFYMPYQSKYGDVDLEKKVYGITTTAQNRPVAINEFINYVLERYNYIYDKKLVDEIIGLVEKNGKVVAAPGLHDDLVMSLALGLYLITQESDTVKRVSMTSRSIRNNYQKYIALNSRNGEKVRSITKEEESTDIYKHYEEQLKDLRNNTFDFDRMFKNLNK